MNIDELNNELKNKFNYNNRPNYFLSTLVHYILFILLIVISYYFAKYLLRNYNYNYSYKFITILLTTIAINIAIVILISLFIPTFFFGYIMTFVHMITLSIFYECPIGCICSNYKTGKCDCV